MVSRTLIFLVTIVTVVTIASAEETAPDPATRTVINGSIVLDKHNFQNVMDNEPLWIVMTYVDWCGHCKELKPKWMDLAGALEAKAVQTKVYSAMIDDNPSIHNDWDVTSFPTIFYVRNGVYKKYQDKREVKNLLQFIENNEEEPVVQLEEDELEEVISGNDVAIVGMFGDLTSQTAKLYETVAWEMEVSSFFAMKRPEGVDSDSVVVYSQLEGKPAKRVLKDELSKERMHHFIARGRRPYVIPFSADNQKLVFEMKSITVSVLIFHGEEGSADRLETFGKIARVHSTAVNFVEMRSDNEYAQRFFSYFNLNDEDMPIVYIIESGKDSKDQRMANTKDISEAGIAQLIEDFTTNQIKTSKPKTTNEPDDVAPQDWSERAVKYLTGANYEEIVLNKEKDVFVMWYKESCPHCQSMESVWAELAEKYQDHPTLYIAHIKSQNLHKVDEVKIEKVPTFMLYKRSANKITEGVECENGRTVADMDVFLFEHVFSGKDEL